MSLPADLGRRTATSIVLAGLIMSAWLTIHLGAIFLWQWSWASAPSAVVLVLVQAWLSTGLFIVAHDCMHGSFAPGRPRLNAMIGTLCLGAYAGISYRTMLPKHYAHHASPGSADDPDFHPDAPRSALPWFIRFFRGYYTHGQFVRITLAAILYLLLGASLINIAMFWALPALLALLQLFWFGTYLPHRHADGSFADRHNARSIKLSPLTSMFTCFHFGGYHHEHHLQPGAPWWSLPRVRAAAAPR